MNRLGFIGLNLNEDNKPTLNTIGGDVTEFILYGKNLIDLIQKGLDVEFKCDSLVQHGKLIIRGIVTNLDHPERITELLETESLLIKTSYVSYVLENIRLLKSTISTCDNYIDLCFRGKVTKEEKLLRDFMKRSKLDE